MSSENSNQLEVRNDLDRGSETLQEVICRAAYGFAVDEVGEIESVAMIGPDGEVGGCA